MSFQIVGLGTAVPKELVTQEDAARLAVELWGGKTTHAAAIRPTAAPNSTNKTITCRTCMLAPSHQ